MASGTITKSFGSGYNIKINWRESSQSMSNNSTTLAVTVTLSATGSHHISSSTSRNISLVINGTTYTGTCTVGISGGATKTLMSKTVTIAHNSDGSKSVSLSVTVGANITLSGSYVGNVTASGTATLTTIPRNSVITSAADVNLGSNIAISWTPATTTYAYRIHLTIVGNNGQWDAGFGVGCPGTTSSYTYKGYTLPLSEIAPYVTNSKTATCTATLYSYTDASYSTQVGSKSSKTFTVTIPSSTAPTISSFTHTLNHDNSVISDWGVCVQGYSSCALTCSASANNGASIASYKFVYGAKSVTQSSDSCTVSLASSGSIAMYCVVTDSRGYTTTSDTYTVTVYSHSSPSISSLVVNRNSKDYSKLDVVIDYSYSSVNGKNSGYGILEYKPSSGTNWTTSNTQLPSNTQTTLSLNLSDTIGYDLRVYVIDSLGDKSSYRTASVTTREVLLDFYKGGKGLGIGKICEGDGFDVNMDSHFRKSAVFDGEVSFSGSVTGNALINLFYPVGSIYETTSSTFNPNTIWGGTWERIKDKFLLSAGDIYAGGTTGGESSHTLTVDEIPSHYHGVYRTSSGSSAIYTFDTSGTSGNASAYAYTSNVGGGETHNNMPPYVAVYVWKRVE